MRKVSIIVHKRRLSNLIEQLGKRGIVHIIVSEDTKSEETELEKSFFAHIGDLSEKLKRILETEEAPKKDAKVDKKRELLKITIEGQDIEDILNQISVSTERIYNKWVELQKDLNNIHIKLDNSRAIVQLWGELVKYTDINFKDIKNFKRLLVRVGYLHWRNEEFFNKSLEKFPHLYYSRRINEDFLIFMITSMEKYRGEIKKIEEDFHATMVENLADVSLEKYNKVIEDLKEIEKRKVNLNNELQTLIETNFVRMKAYQESLVNLKNILRTQQKLNLSYHFLTIEGWVPFSKLPHFKEFIKQLPPDIKVLITDEIELHENPPTVVKRNKITRIFDTITRMYGIPRYREIDPTLLLTISFPILFGLMFGDIGHGLLLLIGGLFIYFWRGKKLSANWRNITLIVAICGLSAIMCGFLYGEFFGLSHHKDPSFPLYPLLFNPNTDLISALKFSVLVGTIMLSLAFALEAINLYLRGKKLDCFLIAIPKIFIFSSGLYIVWVYGFDIFGYFVIWEFLLLFLIPILIIVFGKIIIHNLSFRRAYPSESNIGLLGNGILESWETLLSFLSNVPSFARIFALSLVHIGLSTAVLLLYEMVGTIPVLGAVIFVAGTIFVVIFEFLLVFIHNLRLHFNEFFGKFYHGDGTSFKPFIINDQFSTLVIKKE